MHPSTGTWALVDATPFLLVSVLGFTIGLAAPAVLSLLLWRIKTLLPLGTTAWALRPVAMAAKEAMGVDEQIESLHDQRQQQQQSGGDDDEDDEDEEWSTEDCEETETVDDDDTELERLEELRLKMVLIIWREVKGAAAPDVVTVAAGAAVELVQKIQGSNGLEKWKKWHFWWNRTGCAKIALKCPDIGKLGSVATEAEAAGLPWSACTGSAAASLVEKGVEENIVVRVVAVGPAPSDLLNTISGKFKLLS